jgi:hypothetical protein
MAIVLGGIKAMLSILTTLGLRLPATLVVGNAGRSYEANCKLHLIRKYFGNDASEASNYRQ